MGKGKEREQVVYDVKNRVFLVDAFLSCNHRQVSHMHLLNENVIGALILMCFLLWYSWKNILRLKIIKFNPWLPSYLKLLKRCNPLNIYLQAVSLNVLLLTPFFRKIRPLEYQHHCSVTGMRIGMCVYIYRYM